MLCTSKPLQTEHNKHTLQNYLFMNNTTSPTRTESDATPSRRKLQLSNGYTLDSDQLSRVISTLWKNRDEKRITRAVIMDETGLPNRAIEAYVSMAVAMGIVRRGAQTLTTFGRLVAQHDLFLERTGTLEWCHYCGAGSVGNLVWYDVFNRLLVEEVPMTHLEWNAWFRRELVGQYSDRTIKKVVQEEVNFVIDAYTEKKLATLGVLQESHTGHYSLARRRDVELPLFCGMIYRYMLEHQSTVFEVNEFVQSRGNPAALFALHADALREIIETLHRRGWLRYETTHSLDQIRLIPDFSYEEFLTAYFEGRAPCEIR